MNVFRYEPSILIPKRDPRLGSKSFFSVIHRVVRDGLFLRPRGWISSATVGGIEQPQKWNGDNRTRKPCHRVEFICARTRMRDKTWTAREYGRRCVHNDIFQKKSRGMERRNSRRSVERSSALHSGLPFRNVKKTDLFVVAPQGRARARSCMGGRSGSRHDNSFSRKRPG